MKKISCLLLLLALIVFAAPAQAMKNKDAQKFFYQYIELSANFDVSVASLYADDAKIHAYRRYPNKLERAMEMTGAQWKKLVKKAMPLAMEKGDISKYKKIKISVDGNKIKIKANRYSVLKCYNDTGYYMVIEKDKNKKFKIIEEYVETQPQSNCGEKAKDENLQTLLRNTRDQTNSLLPLMLDADTRLVNAEVVENVFQYQYTLVNYALEELDIDTTRSTLMPIVKNQACSLPVLKQMMAKGAIVSFSYRGKNGKEVATMNITSGDCK